MTFEEQLEEAAVVAQLRGRIGALEAGGGGGGGGPASTTVLGTVKISTAAVAPLSPIAVSDTDPRNADARVPLAHSHAISDVTGLAAALAAAFTSYAQVAKFGVD